MSFTCDIVSAEAKILQVEADEVLARSTEGEFGILTDHQPMLAALQIAPVTVHEAGGTVHHLAVHNGFLYFQDNHLVILADLAELQEDIDHGRAEARLREREQMEEREDREQAVVESSIMKQRTRMTVAKR